MKNEEQWKWLVTAPFSKKYIVRGNYWSYWPAFNYLHGYRRTIENAYLSLGIRRSVAPTESIYQSLERLREKLGSIDSMMLLDTSYYKDTWVVGVVRTESRSEYFVRLYKDTLGRQATIRLEANREKFNRFLSRGELRTVEHQYLRDDLVVSKYVECQARLKPEELQEAAIHFQESTSASNKSIAEESLLIQAEELGRSIGILSGSLDKELVREKELQLFLAHGDFTTRNVFKDNESSIVVFDFENVGYYPPYYDYLTVLFQEKVFSTIILNSHSIAKNLVSEVSVRLSKSREDAKRLIAAYLLWEFIKHARDFSGGARFRLKKRALRNIKSMLAPLAKMHD